MEEIIEPEDWSSLLDSTIIFHDPHQAMDIDPDDMILTDDTSDINMTDDTMSIIESKVMEPSTIDYDMNENRILFYDHLSDDSSGLLLSRPLTSCSTTSTSSSTIRHQRYIQDTFGLMDSNTPITPPHVSSPSLIPEKYIPLSKLTDKNAYLILKYASLTRHITIEYGNDSAKEYFQIERIKELSIQFLFGPATSQSKIDKIYSILYEGIYEELYINLYSKNKHPLSSFIRLIPLSQIQYTIHGYHLKPDTSGGNNGNNLHGKDEQCIYYMMAIVCASAVGNAKYYATLQCHPPTTATATKE